MNVPETETNPAPYMGEHIFDVLSNNLNIPKKKFEEKEIIQTNEPA
jgi:hypothetical protein